MKTVADIKPSEILHELGRAWTTGKDRVWWLEPEQCKVVSRWRHGEVIVALWNKDKPARSADVAQFSVMLTGSVPVKVTREDRMLNGWHGILFRWILTKPGGH